MVEFGAGVAGREAAGKPIDLSSRYLSVGNIAFRLNVSPQEVRQWIYSQELPASYFGGSAGYRIRESDLEEYLNKKMNAAQGKP